MTLSYFIIQGDAHLAARVQLHHLKICTANRQDQVGARALYLREMHLQYEISSSKTSRQKVAQSSYYPSNKNTDTLSTVSLLSRAVS